MSLYEYSPSGSKALHIPKNLTKYVKILEVKLRLLKLVYPC